MFVQACRLLKPGASKKLDERRQRVEIVLGRRLKTIVIVFTLIKRSILNTGYSYLLFYFYNISLENGEPSLKFNW